MYKPGATPQDQSCITRRVDSRRCTSPYRMRHKEDHGSEPANDGETDNCAGVRIPPGVANKTLFHVATVNPFDIAVANRNDLAQINFADPKALISSVDDPAMVISSVAQPDGDISTNANVLEFVSDFHRVRVRV